MPNIIWIGNINKQKAHYLRQNHSKKFPARFMFIDSETTKYGDESVGLQKFRLGVICYFRPDWNFMELSREKWYDVYDAREFLEIIEKHTHKDSPLHVFGSNIVHDLAGSAAPQYFSALKYEANIYHEKGLSFILIIKNKKHTIKFLSMQNFIPTSIKAIGETLGLYKGFADYETGSDEELIKYCRQDVKILKEAVIQWYLYVRKNDLGAAALTLPAQAMKAFRHRFMKEKILLICDKSINDYERASYHGGRTEAFRVGKLPRRKYYKLDINSAYPSVMNIYEYPTRLLGYIEKNNINHLKKTLKKYAVTALVCVETDEPVYCVMRDKKAMFPTGSFWTVLTTRELQYALSKNHLKGIYSGLYYEKKVLFREYVNFFYNMRKKAQMNDNKPYSKMTKLFMNALYGKWAEQYDEVIIDEPTDSDEFRIEEYFDGVTGERGVERVMFHRRQVLQGKVDGRNTFPAISAHITADVRLLLWSYIKKAGRKNVFYCDTDSMIITEKTYNDKMKIFIGEELGQLKVEDTTWTVEIFNLKDYKFGYKRVMKGVQRIVKEDGKEHYYSLHSYGLGTLIRKNINDGAILKNVELVPAREYEKGIVNEDGLVSPFVLYESCEDCPLELSSLSLHSNY